ncbi:uncharacterized protein LOC128237435 isoform X2 [Mya arenaria]|uniref:uncharacterized protein LOC128237435 isoform X2 n=1 Tax=Mya arenaria TaxID=6604 RepID=UPI0022E86534|nr:uncharacterized protein LOC128237435 isoform X2 [Mya arenaria]
MKLDQYITCVIAVNLLSLNGMLFDNGTGEEECAKTYTGAHASEECCNKGCMWGSCLSMVWNTKPVYHYGCHAIGWNGTKDCLEGKIPDIICPTVVGSFCTFNHGECNDITGAFCNTTENTATDITKALCECAAIYQPGKKGDVKCIARDCTDDKFCVDLDKGSKCHNRTCACKEGLAIDSSTKTSTCSQRPDPTTTPAADTCSEVGGKDECCGKALCKFVECTDKTNSTSTITVCYELDSTMTAKCEEEAPDNKCRATNITTTLGPTDPCQAQSNQTACCGQTDDKCVFISCTGLDDQPHTGCHKNSTDYPAFCKDAATDMCKGTESTTKEPTTKASTEAPTDAPTTAPTTAQPTTESNPNSTTSAEAISGGSSEHGQHFDGASFIGGIVLCLGIVAIAFFGCKFYKTRTERNYHTL